jgi:hypothetical protein
VTVRAFVVEFVAPSGSVDGDVAGGELVSAVAGEPLSVVDVFPLPSTFSVGLGASGEVVVEVSAGDEGAMPVCAGNVGSPDA